MSATRLLEDWGRGNREALDELLPLVHTELRKVASRHLGASVREWRIARAWLQRELTC